MIFSYGVSNCMSHLLHMYCQLIFKLFNLSVLHPDDLIFVADLLGLEEHLPLADIGELLGQQLPLGDAVDEDQIYHAHVRVEDSLEEYPALDTLDGNLPGDLFDCNVVRDLDQQIRVRLQYLAVIYLLRREGLLGTVSREVVLAVLLLLLDHIDGALEPLGQQDGILATAWLA